MRAQGRANKRRVGRYASIFTADQAAFNSSDTAGKASSKRRCRGLRTFVDLYTPLVYRFCRKRNLQDADFRDVTQQVLAIIHRTIGKFEYDRERGRFRNWLGAVTAHEISRHQRKDRRPGKGAGEGRGSELASLASAAVDPRWAEEFNTYIFHLALTRIRPEFEAEIWQAFDLTWLHDVKPREAAAKIGKPSAWVYKARYKVIERLRSRAGIPRQRRRSISQTGVANPSSKPVQRWIERGPRERAAE